MLIREFMGADFDAASRILGNTWHARHGARSHWHGGDELCACLSKSDHGFSAMDDEGRLLGVLLLASPRVEDHNETLRLHWLQQRTRLAEMARALGINARADAQILVKEDELMRRCTEQRGTVDVGVVVLLIVSESARGMGVGHRLLNEGLAWLLARGCQTLRLLTDEGCDWQFYEHIGLERVASEVVSVGMPSDAWLPAADGISSANAECESLDMAIFVYEGALDELETRLT